MEVILLQLAVLILYQLFLLPKLFLLCMQLFAQLLQSLLLDLELVLQ